LGVFAGDSSHIATGHVLVGVLGHLLFEQLVRRVLSYHGGHDGDVLLGVSSCLSKEVRLEIKDLSRAKYGPDGLVEGASGHSSK
jgi:hypothetical protein